MNYIYLSIYLSIYLLFLSIYSFPVNFQFPFLGLGKNLVKACDLRKKGLLLVWLGEFCSERGKRRM